jgi:hypothetical protein
MSYCQSLEISGVRGKLVWIVVVADGEHAHGITSRSQTVDHPLDRRAPASIQEPDGAGKKKVQDSFALLAQLDSTLLDS